MFYAESLVLQWCSRRVHTGSQ